MSITIEITPDLEKELQQAAADAGITPDEFILETLQVRLLQRNRVQHLSYTEADLLSKINDSLSHIDWARYHVLIERRDAETLNPDEQGELITLSDGIENANAERIEYLIALADLRKTTLNELMKTLGLSRA